MLVGECGVNGPWGKWSGAKVNYCWFAALYLDLIFRLTFALVLYLLFTSNLDSFTCVMLTKFPSF